MFSAEEYADVEEFYAQERPTMLHTFPSLAEKLGLGELMVKEETSRQGLPAFKVLGVKYAVERLRREGRLPPDAVVACATDGNHGRAVARVAARLGMEAHIFLPAHASERRIESIRGEGAHVHLAVGNYDEAVRQAARESQAHGWVLLSDTSWPGYEEIPRWVMAGYTHILAEASRQWIEPPDVVFVQAGVGGLACGAGSWFAQQFGKWRPFLALCQAANAACIVERARRGVAVRLEGGLETVMDCLSAGEVSYAAWPVIERLYDAYVGVEEEEAVEAAGVLRENGIPAGYSGACGFAALWATMRQENMAGLRAAAGMGKGTRAMVIVTEAQA
ncbi:MAG: pyridoxal-phosphate dependent enzyme [Bryobacterales bacterium]|nr:pyridoxal-phosphate dependent enzyme [Bryobacterales bacterium]